MSRRASAAQRIDPGRLRHAVHLEDVRQLPDGGWRVGEWTVDPRLGCNCPDRQYRGHPCKHELAVRLQRLGPAMLAALRELVAIGEGAG